MRYLFRFAFLSCALLGLVACTESSAAPGANVAVVDTVKVFTESKPGKAAADHLMQVRDLLQKGFTELAAQYKGKEDSPEARRDLAQAQALLQREMAAQEQQVKVELNRCLTEAVVKWRAQNKDFVLVLPKAAALDVDGKIEVTSAILTSMDTVQAVFPPLPTVSVKEPVAEKPAAGKGDGGKKR